MIPHNSDWWSEKELELNQQLQQHQPIAVKQFIGSGEDVCLAEYNEEEQ